jgi:hypothetical protein
MRPGWRPVLVRDVLGRDVEDADLRRHDDEAVLRDDVARRAETVPVEHGADHAAVGERDRRGAVPRFLQAGVVLVERALRWDMPSCPCHASGIIIMIACAIERPVRWRSSSALSNCPESLVVGSMIGKSFRTSSKSGRAEHRLARVHPVHVAAQRVDLAVVRDEAVRVRAIPGRERVRREALVDERQRRHELAVREVVVEGRICSGRRSPCRRSCADERLGR